MSYQGLTHHSVINFPYIDYTISDICPKIKSNEKIYGSGLKMHYFEQSMIHPSYAQHNNLKYDYQRLEYLGDAIFHLILSEYLLKRYPDEDEGFQTRLRIRMERGDAMTKLSDSLKLSTFVKLFDVNLDDSIKEDIFEAFIGAFYLTMGFSYTKEFIINLIEKYNNFSEMIYHDDNYKDLLMRYFHQAKLGHPIYECIKSVDNKITIKVIDDKNKIYATGSGSDKKNAEQTGAKNALIKLKVIINGEIDYSWAEKIEINLSNDSNESDKSDGSNGSDKDVKNIDLPENNENIETKSKISVYNPSNVLMTRNHMKVLIENYGLGIKHDDKINMKLIHEALTHRTYIKKKKLNESDKELKLICVKLQSKSNERLQFLGDAVIHFVICEYLYHRFPNTDEGFLTRLRAKLENRDALFYLAKQFKIDTFVLISQVTEFYHKRDNPNIISGALEAFIGALYLDLGVSFSRELFLAIMKNEVDIDKLAESETNYKDFVIFFFNDNDWGRPKYTIIKESGPGHAKRYKMALFCGKTCIGIGSASSKKRAEQNAAKSFYLKYKAKHSK